MKLCMIWMLEPLSHQSTGGSVVLTKQSHEHVTGLNPGWHQRHNRLLHNEWRCADHVRAATVSQANDVVYTSMWNQWHGWQGSVPGRNTIKREIRSCDCFVGITGPSVDWWLSGSNTGCCQASNNVTWFITLLDVSWLLNPSICFVGWQCQV